MRQKLYFYPKNCYTYIDGTTVEDAAKAINAMNFAYDHDAGVLYYTIPEGSPYKRVLIKYISYYKGTTVETETWLTNVQSYDFSNEEQSITLDSSIVADVLGFYIEAFEDVLAGGSYAAKSYFEAEEVQGEFLHPVDTIPLKALPVSVVGFSGYQAAPDYTHIQIVVAEIQGGTVGGSGHVWQSPFYSKDIDLKTSLGDLVTLCEGQELTSFNVSFFLLNQTETGAFEVVRTYVVGDATTVPTFTVLGEKLPEISIESEENAYCLSPVMLRINRRENRTVQRVHVDISTYHAEFEFMSDRNILEIDLAEYLQTLFADVDLFEYQTIEQTVFVGLYDAAGVCLKVDGVNITVIYGKKPAQEIAGQAIRVQWIDKYGTRHDEFFKIAESVSGGEVVQKFTSAGEEREEKSGEKSVTIAFVGATAAQRAILETIVYSDHVRAFIGEAWKRVKVANNYKNGAGRIAKNFEVTIKYAL